MGAPRLSVVVASHNAEEAIGDCLSLLLAQNRGQEAEIIVADSSSDGTARLVRERYPEIRLLHFPAPRAIPDLRAAAIAAARGEIVAVLDPFCLVEPGWLPEVLRLHGERPEPAIGGAVRLGGTGRESLVRWATYFSEYAAFIPPLAGGPAAELTGNNISYKRRALGDAVDLERQGFWKTFVNWRLKAAGHRLWAAPSLVVTLRKPIPLGEFLKSRYHHGRCFAAMRVAQAPLRTRWLRALTTPLLPGLALWRQWRSVWPKRPYRARFVMAVPLLLLFHVNWAWGELWGYLRGAGESRARMVF